VDLVKLLRDSIDRLPVGPHSAGLNAIYRHIQCAVRHLESNDSNDPDRRTDSIYRTNQAYEGSLKEAYRVLAGKDPAGLATHQIETYLEKNQVVRPRVLTQLTRYRQDYRNPSTHDYKLDFDYDEALLAIVSVCAFAKLLLNQIANKLTEQKAIAATQRHEKPDLKKISDKVLYISERLFENYDFINSVPGSETDGAIQGVLIASGLTEVDLITEGSFWGVKTKWGNEVIGIDTRLAQIDFEDYVRDYTVGYLDSGFEEENVGGGILFEITDSGTDVIHYKSMFDGKPFHLISPADKGEHPNFENEAKNIREIGRKQITYAQPSEAE
jgi:hypothetical protein